MYFRANCITREGAVVAEGGVASVVILPNVAAVPDDRLGFPRWRLFVILKPSIRISNFCASWIENCREIAASHSQNPGPRIEFCPRLPNVPAAGAANAKGFRYDTQNRSGPHAWPLVREEVSAKNLVGTLRAGRITAEPCSRVGIGPCNNG